MAKTLVIKGADFSTNKLTTVSFGEEVPCTGVSLNTDTISFDSLSDTETLTATLTPANTTDTLTWSSSDTSIAVVANGVVTPVGLGSATITATCGNQTATATVTVAVIASPKFDWASAGGSDNLSTYEVKTNWYQLVAFGQGEEATEHAIAPTTASTVTSPYGIKIPQNTAKIKINAKSNTLFYNGDVSRIIWMQDVACGKTGYADNIKLIRYDTINLNSSLPLIATIPENCDAIAVQFRLADAQTSYSSAPDDYATDNELSIEFLAE